MYEFEKHLAVGEFSMAVVNARRFAEAIRQAIKPLEEAAECYRLKQEPYYLETLAFLEQMEKRLMSEPEQSQELRGTYAESTDND